MEVKRVFILGSGFSRAAGLPTSAGLTGELLNYAWDNQYWVDPDAKDWAKSLLDRLRLLEKTESVNFEQFFDYARFYEEAFRMRRQIQSFFEQMDDTAESIERWLFHLQEALVDLLWKKQGEAKDKLSHIERVCRFFGQTDSVLTFNYDTLVERALTNLNKPWDHGLLDSKEGSIHIYKLHGSLDWVVFFPSHAPRLHAQLTRLFPKDNTDYKSQGHNIDEVNGRESKGVLYRYPNVSEPSPYGIPGLGSFKPLHELIGSGKTWWDGFEKLLVADEIYIVGFSLSPFDTMARIQFHSVMEDRRQHGNIPRKVVIVDPEVSRISERFMPVFGPSLTCIEKKVEDVDWGSLLSS